MSKYIIKDWAGNKVFKEDTFPTFEDAWDHIFETFPDQSDDFYEDYNVECVESED